MTARSVWDCLDRHLPRAVDLRRALHACPDLSGKESRTRDQVLSALPGGPSLAVEVAKTGAVLRVGGSGPSVGVRGEMDALPITELTGVDWASKHDGVMHACGHDVHLAALVALAWTVAESPDAHTPLLVVLQPREETYPSGALDIARAGVLNTEQCRYIIGAHIQPALDSGVVACVPGAVNGSSDEFTILVNGEPGHAAYPHLADDPLLALAQTIVALQSIVSRDVDPMTPAVVGVSAMSSGAAANAVPGSASARGTIRSLSAETRQLLVGRIKSISENVAQAHNCRAQVTVTAGEPVLTNDRELAAATATRLREAGLEVDTKLRSLGSDDFSFYTDAIPGLMMFVGSESKDRLHSPTFLPDDGAIRTTARALLAGYLAAQDAIE